MQTKNADFEMFIRNVNTKVIILQKNGFKTYFFSKYFQIEMSNAFNSAFCLMEKEKQCSQNIIISKWKI